MAGTKGNRRLRAETEEFGCSRRERREIADSQAWEHCALCSPRWSDATPGFRELRELRGFSLGLRKFGCSGMGRREIRDSRLRWRELFGSLTFFEQREVSDLRLVWRALVAFRREKSFLVGGSSASSGSEGRR